MFTDLANNKMKFVGVDLPSAETKDIGVLLEGYWLNGVFTITQEHVLKPDPNGECVHRYDATDGIFDYCIDCGKAKVHDG